MISFKPQLGTTFIELIITIIVIGIGISGILLVMNQNISTSSDPLIQHQAIAIAEAYLDEIQAKPFVDPDGVDGELTRNLFDDIDDYNSAVVDGVPRDQGDAITPNGNVIAGLNGYTVNVNVVNEAIGPAGNQTPAVAAYRITVAVSTPTGSIVQLSAYRTNY